MKPDNVFVDSARIHVKAGDGGRGCRSFYRDKYSRYGVPDGGDGGKGADIIIRADRKLYTLLDYKYRREFRGAHGAHGSGNNRKGRDAQPIIIPVPLGTVIQDLSTRSVLRDMCDDAEELLVARGGLGGLGNKVGKEPTEGQAGQEKDLLLDLKVIAGAGIIGFPNAGKSTLISAISNARPRIAAYPFTTKFPILGMVRVEDKEFIVADIPGLIEGASAGRGLGDKFLRHIERTRVLIHVVDMSGFEGRDPVDDYNAINQELAAYSKELLKKPQIIAANKMDLPVAKANLARFKKATGKKAWPVSALEKTGLEDLVEAVAKKV